VRKHIFRLLMACAISIPLTPGAPWANRASAQQIRDRAPLSGSA
jgi:hypothetical protein